MTPIGLIIVKTQPTTKLITNKINKLYIFKTFTLFYHENKHAATTKYETTHNTKNCNTQK